MNNNSKTNALALLVALLMAQPTYAAGLQTAATTLWDDWMWPMWTLSIGIGLIFGLSKNWDAIIDANGTGSRKTGLMNAAIYGGYGILASAVLSLVLAAVKLSKPTM